MFDDIQWCCAIEKNGFLIFWPVGGRLCGDDKPEDVYTTSGSDMTLYFKSDDGVQKSGFDLIVTSYHTGEYLLHWRSSHYAVNARV